MDRAIPAANRICKRREDERQRALHLRRVQNVKPTVDNKMPVVCNMEHVKINVKREQTLEERYREIDEENRILLGKMSDIMNKQPAALSVGGQSFGPKSLNKDARKKELLRITKENQSILKRIQQAQPVYNHVEFECSRAKHEAYLNNISEFPRVQKTPRKPSMLTELSPLPPRSEDAQHVRPHTDRSHYVSSALQAEAKQPREQTTRRVHEEYLPLSDTMHHIEMSTDGSALLIVVSETGEEESNTPLELRLDERAHRKVYREACGKYSTVASRLRVEGGRLVLGETSAKLPPIPPSPQASRQEVSIKPASPRLAAPQPWPPPQSTPFSPELDGSDTLDADDMVVGHLSAGSRDPQAVAHHNAPAPARAAPADGSHVPGDDAARRPTTPAWHTPRAASVDAINVIFDRPPLLPTASGVAEPPACDASVDGSNVHDDGAAWRPATAASASSATEPRRVYPPRPGSQDSVSAEVNFSASGDVSFRLRGLTPPRTLGSFPEDPDDSP